MTDARPLCFAAAVIAALGLARAGAQTIPIVDDAKLPRFEIASGRKCRQARRSPIEH